MRFTTIAIILAALGLTVHSMRDAGLSWRAWNPIDIWTIAPPAPLAPMAPVPRVIPMATLEQPGQRTALPATTLSRPAPAITTKPASRAQPTTLWNGVRFTVLKPGVWQDPSGRCWRPITASTTAYTWVDGTPVEPGKTAKRTCAKTTYGIASDWSVIKPGTKVWVPGYGIQLVDDKCGRSMDNWKSHREIVLDLRIPNQRHDGLWRSNRDIVRIATRHGYQRKRTVLVQIDSPERP
jgi:hypothetical protein